MRVLAIDSSGLTATVAVVEDDRTIAEYTTNFKKTHSQTLLPMIDEMMKMIEMDVSDVDAIAVAGGPGSFTGLRIGSATAKGLGLALDKPLIHVPTLDAMAYSLYGCEDIICPVMDARRKQVYTGLYSFARKKPEDGSLYDEPVFQVLRMQMAVPVEELIRHLNVYRRRVVFLGDGVAGEYQPAAAGLIGDTHENVRLTCRVFRIQSGCASFRSWYEYMITQACVITINKKCTTS